MIAEESSAFRQGVMLIAIALALYAQNAVHQRSDDTAAWWTLVVAAVLAAIAAGQRAALPAVAVLSAPGTRSAASRLALGGLAVAAIAATTYISTKLRLPVLALILWLASPVVASFAVRGWQVTPPRRAAVAWSAVEVGLLFALVVVAALARMLWLATLPRGIFGDEPRVAMYLYEAYRGDAVPPFFTMGWNTWPVIGLSLQGLFAPLFGVHIWTLRLSSAFFGTLGVVTTYLLARELFGTRAAFAAAALFAICRTAIDFSRLGIAHAQVLFLEPLAFFLLWRALNGGRALAYLWAGVVTAWCLYSYNAGQLVPPLVFGWLMLGALFRPSRLRTHWRGAALLTIAFALTLFPYLYYFTDAFAFTGNWGQWTIMARNRQTLGNVLEAWHANGFTPAWAILKRQVWATWLGFGVLPGGGYTLGYRGGGMLDDVSAALFALGLGMAIRRLRRGPDAFLLYWWLGTVFAGGIATIDPPSFVRMVGIIPVLAILAALPLEWLTRPVRAGARQLAANLLAVALLIGAGWDNYRTYFVTYAATPADPLSELARFMESLPPDHQAALLGTEHFLQFRGELFLIEFPDRWRDVAEPAHFLPLHEAITTPLVLVLGPSQVTLSDYVRGLYPQAEVRDVSGADGQPPVFRAVWLQPDVVRARTGLALQAQSRGGSARELGAADPFADHLDGAGDAQRLAWSGSIYWPDHRPLQVVVDAGQPTTIRFGDAPPIVSDGTSPISTNVTLPRGWQPFSIDEQATSQRRLAISLGASTPRVLSRWDFRPDAGQGLRARYLRSDGTRIDAIDPQLDAYAVEDRFAPNSELVVRMPFNASWRGALRVDAPGTYQFEAMGSGPYTVLLDKTPLLGGTPERPEDPVVSRASRSLTPGAHPIEVTFDSTKAAHTTRRMFQLFWTPPGGNRELIPPTHFVPGD